MNELILSILYQYFADIPSIFFILTTTMGGLGLTLTAIMIFIIFICSKLHNNKEMIRFFTHPFMMSIWALCLIFGVASILVLRVYNNEVRESKYGTVQILIDGIEYRTRHDVYLARQKLSLNSNEYTEWRIMNFTILDQDHIYEKTKE